MREQSSLRMFTRYTVPSVFGTLGVSCYILADTFFVSQGLGTAGLAALNLAIPVYNLIHGTGLMLGMGGATRFSVCKSRNDPAENGRIFTNTMRLAALFSMAFFLIGLFLSKDLARFLGADESVLPMTETYLRVLLIFSPTFICNDVLLCFVRNDGAPRLAMTAMLVGSFANILLDWLFIFPLKMGIFGAVFATGLSPVISLFVLLPHRIKRKNTFNFIKMKTNVYLSRQTFALGFSSFIAELSSGVVMIVFNAVILRLEGNTGVAAYGVVANLSLVLVAVYTGIAQGAQPLYSEYYGRGEHMRVRELFRFALVAATALSFVLYLLIAANAAPITAVFNSENDLRMREIAVPGLRLYFLASVFVGCNTVLAGFLAAVERPLPAQLLSLLRGLVLIVPMAFLLSAVWGMTGVWLAYPITESLVALVGATVAYRYRKNVSGIDKGDNV